MGLFDGIGNASMSAGGVYFLVGLYRVEIERVLTKRSRKGADLFIVETTILESNNSDRPEGISCSWIVNRSNDAALGNIKKFLAATQGLDPADPDNEDQINEEVTADVVEFAVSDENPLEGIVLDLEATNIKTRAGGDFTLHTWSPVEDEDS